jgi:type II secretory pathway pseudopilin PulG
MSPASPTRAIVVADRRCGERGFALLEILVAFVILALGLAAILVGVSTAMRSDAKTQTSRGALRVVQSRLEAAGVSEALLPGYREGRVGNRYTWRQTVTAVRPTAALSDPGGGKTKPTAANATVAAFWVEVAVQAGDGTTARLAGLKLEPVAKP